MKRKLDEELTVSEMQELMDENEAFLKGDIKRMRREIKCS